MGQAIGKIECFSAFRKSMLDYFASSGDDGKRRRKSTISHRIALSMQSNFPSQIVDIDYDKADILVHTGDGEDILAVFWSNTYLTQAEKEKAQHFHLSHNPALTLAFSLLEDKDYILVYRFESNYLDYLHINKSDFSEMLLKRCLIEDEKEKKEPSLFTKKKKSKT